MDIHFKVVNPLGANVEMTQRVPLFQLEQKINPLPTPLPSTFTHTKVPHSLIFFNKKRLVPKRLI